MNQRSTIFLQVVMVLIGIAALFVMIRVPLTEGRAATLDLFSIYSDPFILYGYAASAPFFTALYQTFILLSYIRQNKTFSPESVKAVKNIQNCSIIQSILIVLAAVLIRIFHNKEDDPAGFIALCMGATFVCIVIGTAAAVFGKILQQGSYIKSQQEQLQHEAQK
jgi:cytochrome bd-type quinol oxidase subunit 2